MLASRTLPPILRTLPPPPHPPPLATFYNIPRRYERSARTTMGDDAAPAKDEKSVRQTRKSSRAQPTRSVSSPSSAQPPGELQSLSSSTHPSLVRMTRKRAHSLNEDVGIRDSREGDLNSKHIGSASSTGSGDLSGHVCLCQPEPKIPRPRNAFILYRQHHQHNIVARHPGLANPEISKIIGQQWKSEDEKEKEKWKDLAETEKERHQEQYPDYRYQPRRVGKPGSLPVNPSGQHTTVDKYRCPRCGGRNIKTPTSPFLNTPGFPSLPPPNTSEGLTSTTRYLPMTNNLSLDSPALRRQRPGPSNLGSISVPPSAAVEPPMYSPLSPDPKRRRYNYPITNNGRRTESGPYYAAIGRRDSLPPILSARQTPPNTATMPPSRTPRRPSSDLNLFVPSSHDQSRSVEAMVMSVPYLVKVKVLGRITPPLKEPGPTSPAIQIRGAILAVEGDEPSAVEELSTWLKEFLEKDKEYQPRIAVPPRVPEEDKGDVTFEDYLDLVRDWHGKSREMIQYITSPLSESRRGSAASDSNNDSPSPDVAPKPIVILPTYQLHASNVYTSRIPITDAYSPTDHWQWIATLWRGTVGPDLTIYVKTFDKNSPGMDDKERDAVASNKLVELDDSSRCLTVRREKGERFDARALRRVGFEVSEWIQGVTSKGGR